MKEIVLIEPMAAGPHFFRFIRLPRLGLPLLGAILKKLGYQVRIFCEDLAPIDWKRVLNADLVGISSITSTATRAYWLIRKIKEKAWGSKKDLPVVMGGPHVTFLPEEALSQGADYVVRGEGEKTIVELVNFLEGRGDLDVTDILGLSYRQGEEIRHNPARPLLQAQDLDSLPFPDLSLIAGFERISAIPIQTSRGCPYNCKFCSVVKMFGRGFRARSIEHVLAELKELHKQRPFSHVFFYDDNFSADSKRTAALLEGMIKEKTVPRAWSAQERVRIAQERELLKLMRKSHCTRLYLGLESINPVTLKDYRKGQKVEDIERAIETIHKYKIGIHGMFVFGSDGDKISTIQETLEFSCRKRIESVQYSILTPLPGTDTYQELDSAGRIFLKGAEAWAHYDGHHVVYQPKLMSPWQLQIAVIEALNKFYSYWRFFKSALRGRFANSFFAFQAQSLLRRWNRQNKDFLNWLKRWKEEA